MVWQQKFASCKHAKWMISILSDILYRFTFAQTRRSSAEDRKFVAHSYCRDWMIWSNGLSKREIFETAQVLCREIQNRWVSVIWERGSEIGHQVWGCHWDDAALAAAHSPPLWVRGVVVSNNRTTDLNSAFDILSQLQARRYRALKEAVWADWLIVERRQLEIRQVTSHTAGKAS